MPEVPQRPDAGADIRLLGRLIGDVLREQAGERTFELVERVRRLAVAERRSGDDPMGALTAALTHAGLDDQVHLIRAFGWLSLLANTAEDLHFERRRRHHLDAAQSAGTATAPAGRWRRASIACSSPTSRRVPSPMRWRGSWCRR